LVGSPPSSRVFDHWSTVVRARCGWRSRDDAPVPDDPYYGTDLARIHHERFGFHADSVAPGIVQLLEPVRAHNGLVLEIGCGSGLLTKHLVEAGHRVVATDASPAMLELARRSVPDAEAIEPLRLPDDPVPTADAIVSAGHALSYLDDEHQLRRALAQLALALTPDGILAFDICDVAYGEARHDAPPNLWFADDWLLMTRTSVPHPRAFRRDMTMFVRAGTDLWRRVDERHDNILVDTRVLPTLLAEHGVRAELRSAFGQETLPAGLVVVVGRKTSD
jgi:SAM-dependent methyltransferase